MTDGVRRLADEPVRLVRDLVAVVGGDHVLTDRDLTAAYETDWTGGWSGRAAAVVRPGSAGQVAAVVRACAAHRVPVVPQGGNTGLVGGSVPAGGGDGAVVVSLARLTDLEPVDPIAGQVGVGAGVTLADLQRHVRSAGSDIGVDFASRESATIGGIVATNAGGERVLRHGMTRAQVAGIEAVLADGSVVRQMSGLPKDNVGYDLPTLFTGSEGTLGLVTRVRLRLVPLARSRVTALLALPDTAAAVAAVGALRRLPSLDAAELVYPDGVQLVCEQFGLPAPLPTTAGAMLLVECVGDTDVDPSAALAEAVDGLPGVLDAAVAIDAAGRERLWAYREGHTEAVARLGRPLKLDVAVPLPALPDAERELRAFVAERAPGARLYLWGHLAEGNLHINIVRPGDRPAAGATGPIAATAATGPTAATGAGASGGTGAFDLGDDTLADGLLRLVAAYGGSIGAEHGVGRAKVRWVGLSRGEAERAVLRLVKRALDPLGLMNPGVLVPPYGVGAYAAGVPRPS